MVVEGNQLLFVSSDYWHPQKNCFESKISSRGPDWERQLQYFPDLKGKILVTIQHILPRLAKSGLIYFHEIWILTLKKQCQCLRGPHALLATS